MVETSPKAKPMLDWVFTEWADKLTAILESMADERPKMDRRGAGDGAEGPGTGALLWEQRFAMDDGPLVWIAAPEGVAREIGERTLKAAGVESTDPTDARNTFLELLSQSMSALGQSFTAQLACDASAGDGASVTEVPVDLHWVAGCLAFADKKMEAVWLACSHELLERLIKGAESARPEPEDNVAAATAEIQESRIVSDLPIVQEHSRTFDLLLDVTLSVSVSFGRTFLPIKDVLKLTTGSIVELDRAVSEPVEIIVNNCVIARGEVVVVEGNYGVRISQIASRHDRLKTGSAAAEMQ